MIMLQLVLIFLQILIIHLQILAKKQSLAKQERMRISNSLFVCRKHKNTSLRTLPLPSHDNETINSFIFHPSSISFGMNTLHLLFKSLTCWT